ncbi:hypothetical protein [Variovorax gossypii]
MTALPATPNRGTAVAKKEFDSDDIETRPWTFVAMDLTDLA